MFDAWKLPWTGACRCDRVAFEISQPPIMTMACHCTGCQRMSSSAFSLTLMVPEQGFTLTRGELVVGGLHGASVHLFCGWCMTWLLTRPEGAAGFVNVRPTMLSDASWVWPFIETYVCERLPWATTPARHSFDKLPDPTAYGPLMKEFVETGPRPG